MYNVHALHLTRPRVSAPLPPSPPVQEEISLKAQAEGDLTEAQERSMIERAKNLTKEASGV